MIIRRIGIVAASLLIGLSTLTGCTKCIKETTEPVKVKIVNEYYDPGTIRVAGYSDGRPIMKTNLLNMKLQLNMMELITHLTANLCIVNIMEE